MSFKQQNMPNLLLKVENKIKKLFETFNYFDLIFYQVMLSYWLMNLWTTW